MNSAGDTRTQCSKDPCMCMCGQELGDAHKILAEGADWQQNVKIKLSVTLVKPVNGESNFLTFLGLVFWYKY